MQSPEDADRLQANLVAIYGTRFHEPACRDLDVCRTTLWRWLSGGSRIPRTAVLAVDGLLRGVGTRGCTCA